eukprot:scaffold10887_cov109-Isochrysis_galbana.AAC.4
MASVRRGEPSSATLVNYKKGGKRFVNQVRRVGPRSCKGRSWQAYAPLSWRPCSSLAHAACLHLASARAPHGHTCAPSAHSAAFVSIQPVYNDHEEIEQFMAMLREVDSR